MLELKTKIVFDPKEVTRKHKEQGKWKKVVICETRCDLHEYYAWFLEKRFNLILNKPLRSPHITIVNDVVKDNDMYENMKSLLNGKEIIFKFDPAEIRSNGKHWWIRAHSDEIANIRTVLGLDAKPTFCLHITIGLVNDKNRAHSDYILNDVIMKFNI